MRSKTVKESLGLHQKATVIKHPKGIFEHDKTPVVQLSIFHVGSADILLTSKRARKLFEAGIQMCDELEGVNNDTGLQNKG